MHWCGAPRTFCCFVGVSGAQKLARPLLLRSLTQTSADRSCTRNHRTLLTACLSLCLFLPLALSKPLCLRLRLQARQRPFHPVSCLHYSVPHSAYCRFPRIARPPRCFKGAERKDDFF